MNLLRPLRLHDVQTHHVLLVVVEEDADDVERDDVAQPARQVVEQFGQVAVPGDRFGDFQQRPVGRRVGAAVRRRGTHTVRCIRARRLPFVE